MSALHRGYRKFAVHPEKKPDVFQGLFWSHNYLVTSSLRKETVVLEIVWKSLEFWIQKSVHTRYIYTSDPAEGTTFPLRLGEAFIPQPRQNYYWKLVRFYIPNLPNLVSPFLQKLGVYRTPWCLSGLAWGLADSIWVNIMRSCEQVVCKRRRKNKMLGKKEELATIFDKFSFPSWKQWETASRVNFFIFTTWHEMDLWCINWSSQNTPQNNTLIIVVKEGSNFWVCGQNSLQFDHLSETYLYVI